MNLLTSYYGKNKRWMLTALAATFLWGMAAHGYMFTNNAFSHDSLNELHGAILGNDIRLFSGRVFVPLYRDLLRSDVTLPWLIGLLALLWASVAVYFVLRIFQVETKWEAALIAGIFVTNTTFSGTAATYLHDLDCFLFSLMLACAAVWLWRYWKWGYLAGAVLITGSLGMYQSFLFTGVALVMFASILDLMEGEKGRTVLLQGIKSLVMFAIGGALYWIAVKLLSGDQLSTGYYNSMDLMLEITPARLPGLIRDTYADWLYRLWHLNTVYPTALVRLATLALAGLGAVSLGLWLLDKRAGVGEKALCLALAALLPLGMNMICLLTGGMNHDLMVFAIWTIYLLDLLLARWLWKRLGGRIGSWQRWLAAALVALLMYGNVQTANGMYLKKDLEYDAYLSLMTRVADKLEGNGEYIPGQTPVIFVGLPGHLLNPVIPGFKDYWNVTGMLGNDVIFMPERSRYQAYFDYVLGLPILLADEDTWFLGVHSDFAKTIPSYPSRDFMQMKDGILYVKLGPAGGEE